MCVESWGKVIRERLDILESWAHKQGLELAAECHLAKINQCADFLQVNFNFVLIYFNLFKNVIFICLQIGGQNK